MEKSRVMSGPILVLVQLIESLAFALPLSFFPNYVRVSESPRKHIHGTIKRMYREFVNGGIP